VILVIFDYLCFTW